MNNIEIIEQLLTDWKAKAKEYKEINFDRNYQSCQDTILGLNLALDAIKEPSNTQLKINGLPCAKVVGCEFIEQWCSEGQCDFFTPTT